MSGGASGSAGPGGSEGPGSVVGAVDPRGGETIGAAAARRIALAAQGFGGRHPEQVGTRQLNGLMRRLELLQLDSVNVFERSHYLPVFARLGGYDKALLDRLTLRPRTPYLEYWAHEAALVPVDSWPLFQWRMARSRARSAADPDDWSSTHRPMLDWLRAELAANGPMAASEVEHDANRRSGPWWGWSDVKTGLEVLFRWGEAVTAGRVGFERRYALAADILPSDVLDREVPRSDAIRALTERAARAHGIGTASDLADYFRLPVAETVQALGDLGEEGAVVPVTVRGWERAGRPQRAWVHRDVRRPRAMSAEALLSPFDPVVWRRERALRMFGLHYRIEIYTPESRRTFGYYTLPVLVDDRIVARIDLKNDRQAGVLRVRAAWTEPAADAAGVPTPAVEQLDADTVDRIAALLGRTASWQGLDMIEVEARGTLAPGLAAAVASL